MLGNKFNKKLINFWQDIMNLIVLIMVTFGMCGASTQDNVKHTGLNMSTINLN